MQDDLTPQEGGEPSFPKTVGDFFLPLNAMPVGCMVLGKGNQIKYWNPAAEQTLGYSAKEAHGKHPTELIFLASTGHQFTEAITKVGEGQIQAQILESTARDGTRIPIKWHFIHWNDDSPYILGVMEMGAHRQTGLRNLRARERINALRIIDTAISGSMDFQTTLNIILQQMMSQLNMDAAVILVREPFMNSLKFAASRGLRTSALQYTNLRIGDGLAGKAALSKETFEAPDLQNYIQSSFARSPLFTQENFKSYYCVPLIAKGEVKGVMESFHRSPFQADAEWLEYFETLGGQAAIAIENALLFKNLQQSNLELMMAYDSTLEGWSKALDLRDRDTEGHTRRVAELTDRLARHFGVSEADRVHIRRGALLHDIGKMGIPDAILHKEGPLTNDEWLIMKRHPYMALSMLSSIAFLRSALDIPYSHHEKWDGSGYPRRLKGEQIPFSARIFAVVDVFDALTSKRPYRKAWTEQEALDYIQAEAGKHFDPKIVPVFIQHIYTQQR